MDVCRILLVPLCTGMHGDDRVWIGNEDGVFRVKEAYKIARMIDDCALSSYGADPTWKKLWTLNISPKTKMFLWRALWDIIPHTSNLQKKGVTEFSKCLQCGLYESSLHIFRNCS